MFFKHKISVYTPTVHLKTVINLTPYFILIRNFGRNIYNINNESV